MERNAENGVWTSALKARAVASAKLALIGQLVRHLAPTVR